MDNEFETVNNRMRDHGKLLYRRFAGQLPHLLTVTLLLVVFWLAVMAMLPLRSNDGGGHTLLLLHDAHGIMAAVSVAACAVAAACAYALSWSRAVYLVDFAGYKPAPAHAMTRAKSIRHYEVSGAFTPESMAFQKRILERSGLGDATHYPASLLKVPADMRLRTANEESHPVVFGVIDELLAKTRVRPFDIGVIIVNSSLYSPTPSFTSLVVNRYSFRNDVVTHNLSGMGCSAGIIAIDLARRLLQVHIDTYALVASTENITLNGYLGNYRPMLVTNMLFRMGGAAILLSNRSDERRRAKYQLIHAVRTHCGASDQSYGCVMQEEDEAGHLGVSLSKDLMSVAAEALRTNIITLRTTLADPLKTADP